MELVESGRRHIPTTRIEAGDYLEFVYNGKRRTVVVVAADYKDNVEAYEVTETDRDELIKEVLSWEVDMVDGLLWHTFGSGTWPYKSFKREKIHSPLRVSFKYKEDNENHNQPRGNRLQQDGLSRTPRVQNPGRIG